MTTRPSRSTRVLLGAAFLGLAAGCRPAQSVPTRAEALEGPRRSDVSGESGAPGKVSVKDSKPPAPGDVRLVLWITVDQLRGDSLHRFAHLLEPGGFERLLRRGAYYPNAHFTHAITETAPGHATLFTGAPPAEHGVIGNAWLDQQTGAEVAAVQDERAPLVGLGSTSAAPPSAGRSPRNLLLPTLGDALTAASAGRAKVFSISAKDRAAILPGGLSGKAFWLGAEGFITSRYYYEELPSWAAHQATQHPISRRRGTEWTLLHPAERYQRAAFDDRASERPAFGLGRTFPHPITGEGAALTRAVAATPLVDELTVSFALRALAEENLGEDEVPDLLAVSLSATDRVGHAFGPESLEAEDNFARLDRQLARLLDGVTERVGPGRTLFVLSADHGGCETSEHTASLGLPSARIEPADLLEDARAWAQRELGDPMLVLGYANPSLWLDRARIQRRGLSLRAVASDLAEVIRSRGDVYDAFALEGLLEDPPVTAKDGGGSSSPPPLAQRVRASVHPRRSGDVYVVPRPHTLLLQAAEIAATHGSPWAYDSHVPLILAGPGVRAGRQPRSVGPHQLAATVAQLLGIPAPAGASKETLTEALAPGSSAL